MNQKTNYRKNISIQQVICPKCNVYFIEDSIHIHMKQCTGEVQRTPSSRSSTKSYNSTINQHSMTVVSPYQSSSLVSTPYASIVHFLKEYEQLFTSFVSGKTIALVGPAKSILGTGKGYIIDKFDLVVRLNKSIPLPDNLRDDIGTRTDIIYNSLNTSDFPGENNLNPKLYKKYDVKFVCSSYPFYNEIFRQDILNYIYKYKFEIPFKVMDDNKYRKFEKYLGTRPYTGTCAIMELLSYPIKYLYITGLDFYQTKYYNEYRHIKKGQLKNTRNNTIHNYKPQLEYLKEMAFYDHRIILDSFLDEIIFHEYQSVLNHLEKFDILKIFAFGDEFLQKYFELKAGNCTFTKKPFLKSPDESIPYMVFTTQQKFEKKPNQYVILVEKDKRMVNFLNKDVQVKKFVGSFYYTNPNTMTKRTVLKGEEQLPLPSVFLQKEFLDYCRSILSKIKISNCNLYLIHMIGIMLFFSDTHCFSYKEVFEGWGLNNHEKKLALFLMRKKKLMFFD